MELIPNSYLGLLGIVASLGCGVERIVHFRNKRLRKKGLRRVFGLKHNKCSIVFPVHSKDKTKPKNLYGVGHMIDAANRLGIDYQLVPSGSKERVFEEQTDIIAIGGPKSNSYTEKVIEEHSIPLKWNHIKTNSPGFKIGIMQTLHVTDKYEPAIIRKLSAEETNEGRTIILIIGYTAQGTSAAAHYLLNEYRQINKEFGDNGFFIHLKVPKDKKYSDYEKKHYRI